MKLEEAWEISVSGVAVLGNEVMQDVIWQKDSPYPFVWITNGYTPMKDISPEFRNRNWKPLHRRKPNQCQV